MKRSEAIAVIDLGGQYAHLIATKLRRRGFYSEIRDASDPPELLAQYAGIVLSGSPSLSSHDEGGDNVHLFLDLDVPVLGFCFGHQEIAKHYGGRVIRGRREYGPAVFEITTDSPLLEGIPRKSTVWMSHGDSVSELPPGFTELGFSHAGDGPHHRYAAMGSDELKRYGFQFHPEVDDTEYGEEMLANFASRICGLEPTWNPGDLIQQKTEELRQYAGKKIWLLVSGGVDSTVVGELLLRALPAEDLTFIHVDTGFMREGESESVAEYFKARMGERFKLVDASDLFLERLAGVTDPETKRRIIGETFIHVVEQEMGSLEGEAYLAQGTIYPDTVETGGPRRAKVIKTHHNRVPLVEELIRQGRVIEPISDLYKVEVRQLGRALGIPDHLIERHPFPGPGLAVRVLAHDGSVLEGYTIQPIEIIQEFLPTNTDAVLLPIRSVGVKADLRSYELPVMLQGCSIEESMALMPRIIKEADGINRVVHNLCARLDEPRPRAAGMTRSRVELLRKCDHIVHETLATHGLTSEVWQFPVVLVPLDFGERGQEVVILRPVRSQRAMTATVPRLPDEFLQEVTREIMALPGIAAVLLDVTTKPPGTIEWE